MTNSTVSGNTGAPSLYWVSMTLINTLLEGDYAETPDAVSLGNNIESPGNTCGLDQPTDQVNVTAEQLALGPLQDNGGPTETHALGAGSVAINQIPEANCVVADGAPLTTDERGEPRPAGAGFDVGAFEVQP
ncbi:MAG: choice-of-anchor Q domain-containing protein [Polyangiales bacterium]